MLVNRIHHLCMEQVYQIYFGLLQPLVLPLLILLIGSL